MNRRAHIEAPQPGVQEPPVPLDLEAFLPYRLNILSSLVADGFARSYAAQSAQFGIDGPRWRVISFLGERLGDAEAAAMTARDICARTRMTKVMVSRAIAELESAGFVKRRTHAGDRRQVLLDLTASGKRIYWAIAPVALDFQQRLFDGIAERDRATLFRIIDRLQARALALGADPGEA